VICGELWIDSESRTVGRAGNIVRLTDTEFCLFSILWKAYPKGFAADEMRKRLWAHRHDGGPLHRSNMSVQVCTAERKLKRLDISLRSERGTRTVYRIGLPSV
jgi:DNA-binding response OmpR family regulator